MKDRKCEPSWCTLPPTLSNTLAQPHKCSHLFLGVSAHASAAWQQPRNQTLAHKFCVCVCPQTQREKRYE